MKKLLLLALIVLSCLAFASCDAVQQFVPGLDLGGGIGNKADITEEEWLELVSETNYSSNYTYYENQDGELVATVNFERKFDNTTSYEKRIENGEISFEEYITVMDNNGYSIVDNNYSDGFVLYPLDSIPEPTPLMSEEAAKKCYQYLKETNENTYTIKYKSSDYYTLEYVIELQDGKIVSMTETYTHKNGDDKMETKFFNIGTTVIELPEFTYADDTEEVRTTITKEEWLSAINSTNFSMVGNNYNSNGDVIMIQSMYFSETAALVYSWAELGDTLTENAQYTAIIDGVGYTITKEDSGYVGVATDTTVEKLEIKLCQANASVVDSWENLYDTFVYDEESKTYKANCTYSGNEATFEAFFEDGKVIKFEIKFVKYGNNCTVTYSNFGTTVIEIPEFVLAE